MSLTVIIPSKSAANLAQCLPAVYRHEPEARTLVIDDGVDWQAFHSYLSPEILGVWQATIELVMAPKPFCYARNCNLGIRMAEDDVVLLNDDALLETPGGFSAMQREAEAHYAYGVISATTNVVGNPAQHQQAIGLRSDPRTVAFVCVLIPRRTIERVGLLDERFGGMTSDGRRIYGFEDNDYCRRVREAGQLVGIFDGCYVDHGSLRSTFRGDPRAPGDIGPGAKLYLEKWGDLN